MLLLCFFSCIVIIYFIFFCKFSQKRLSRFSWNFQNLLKTKFVRNWSIKILIVTSGSEILKILCFCLWLIFLKNSERLNCQVFRDDRKSSAAELPHIQTFADTTGRNRKEMKNLNFSNFSYLNFLLLFDRDALKTFEYEICFIICPRILEIFGSKVLMRESA